MFTLVVRMGSENHNHTLVRFLLFIDWVGFFLEIKNINGYFELSQLTALRGSSCISTISQKKIYVMDSWSLGKERD